MFSLCLTEGEDFTTTPDNTLTINPGQTQSCFSIEITDDSDPENIEAFSISFSFPGMPSITPVSSMVTILDDDVGMSPLSLRFVPQQHHP